MVDNYHTGAAKEEREGRVIARNILGLLIPEPKITTAHGSYRAADKCAMFDSREGGDGT